MGGIFFLRTNKQSELETFYTERLGMERWLQQPDCIILKHGNLLLGFCQRDTSEVQGMITFVYDTKEKVEQIYRQLEDIADNPPRINKKYQIYQFFAKDPEGRILEFQVFLHSINEI